MVACLSWIQYLLPRLVQTGGDTGGEREREGGREESALWRKKVSPIIMIDH